jgi:hypothetical protein
MMIVIIDIDDADADADDERWEDSVVGVVSGFEGIVDLCPSLLLLLFH